MTMLCSDKTGTLTLNKMVIQPETPIFSPGESQYSLLRYAAMAAKWKASAHPCGAEDGPAWLPKHTTVCTQHLKMIVLINYVCSALSGL
jgi:magnesium-transporting ATPase (P-type)